MSVSAAVSTSEGVRLRVIPGRLCGEPCHTWLVEDAEIYIPGQKLLVVGIPLAGGCQSTDCLKVVGDVKSTTYRRRLDQGVEEGTGISPVLTLDEEPVLLSGCEGADCPFSNIVVRNPFNTIQVDIHTAASGQKVVESFDGAVLTHVIIDVVKDLINLGTGLSLSQWALFIRKLPALAQQHSFEL